MKCQFKDQECDFLNTSGMSQPHECDECENKPEVVSIDGVDYMKVKNEDGICFGCAFWGLDDGCYSVRPPIPNCTGIIFVKA